MLIRKVSKGMGIKRTTYNDKVAILGDDEEMVTVVYSMLDKESEFNPGTAMVLFKDKEETDYEGFPNLNEVEFPIKINFLTKKSLGVFIESLQEIQDNWED
mgnify:FL=1